MKIKHIILSLVLSLSAFAESYTDLLPMGGGSKYACIYTDANKYHLVSYSTSGVKIQNAASLRAKINSSIKSIQGKIRKKKTNKLTEQLAEQRKLLADIGKCNKKTLLAEVFHPCRVISGLVRQSTRIISGYQCEDLGSSFVQIRIGFNNSTASFCTGTVISPNKVITAGHCFNKPVGVNYAYITDSDGSTKFASGYVVHPLTNGIGINDMTIVTFSSNLQRPITYLNGSNFLKGNPYLETGIIGGYGEDEDGFSGRFKASAVRIERQTSNGILIKFYPGDSQNQGNTCYGDSGGPLLIKRNGKWVLAGNTSYGDNDTCGVDGNLDNSYFSDIRANLDFIAANAPDAQFWK